jgi:DNA-directed RNA polymerase specialized sigma24 family protein
MGVSPMRNHGPRFFRNLDQKMLLDTAVRVGETPVPPLAKLRRVIVDPDVLARARNEDREAVIEVLAAQYPSTYRIAHAISGRADVGDGVVAYVTKQSFRVVEKWEDEEAPQRWFRHHALLTLRRASKWEPEAASDTLVPDDARGDANYVAFVRAIRALPQQQVEAFLLTHGERLDLRNLAVAMDCSTTAASVHLGEAEERVRALAGAEFGALVMTLRAAYERLTPSRDLVLSRVVRLRRRLWPRVLKRIAKLVVLLTVLAVLAWVASRFGRPVIDFWRGILTRAGVA